MSKAKYTYPYLEKYRDRLSKVIENHDVNEEELQEIVDYFFETLREYITDRRMPKIQITNFGTFKPTIGMMNWWIQRELWFYKMGYSDRERVVDKITHLWIIKQRLIKEKNGEATWEYWRKNTMEQIIKDEQERRKKRKASISGN